MGAAARDSGTLSAEKCRASPATEPVSWLPGVTPLTRRWNRAPCVGTAGSVAMVAAGPQVAPRIESSVRSAVPQTATIAPKANALPDMKGNLNAFQTSPLAHTLRRVKSVLGLKQLRRLRSVSGQPRTRFKRRRSTNLKRFSNVAVGTYTAPCDERFGSKTTAPCDERFGSKTTTPFTRVPGL